MKTTIAYEVSYDAESDIEYIGVVGGVGPVGGPKLPVYRFLWVEKYPEGIFDVSDGMVDVWIDKGEVVVDDFKQMPPRQVTGYIEEFMRKHYM